MVTLFPELALLQSFNDLQDAMQSHTNTIARLNQRLIESQRRSEGQSANLRSHLEMQEEDIQGLINDNAKLNQMIKKQKQDYEKSETESRYKSEAESRNLRTLLDTCNLDKTQLQARADGTTELELRNSLDEKETQLKEKDDRILALQANIDFCKTISAEKKDRCTDNNQKVSDEMTFNSCSELVEDAELGG